jgi:hypothetical protein
LNPAGKEMMFCTVKAKEDLLEELKKIDHDKQADFITRKQSEKDTILAVRTCSIYFEEVDLKLIKIESSTLRNVISGQQVFRLLVVTNERRSERNGRMSEYPIASDPGDLNLNLLNVQDLVQTRPDGLGRRDGRNAVLSYKAHFRACLI